MNSVLEEIIIALVSAAIAGSIARAIELARRQRIKRKALRDHPIEGVYASSYTDEIKGVQRTIRDEVTIKQHGLEFTGISRNLVSSRTFQLRGQIVNDRCLTGTYSGEHRADAASGVFYLMLDLLREGYIQGLWAGFGGEAGVVLSGTWTWRRLRHANIRVCHPDDMLLPSVQSLLNDALGIGYVTDGELRKLAASESGVVLVAAGENGELLGAATAYVLDEDEKTELAGKLAGAGVRRTNLVDQRVGILKSSAVVPVARGQGLGLALVDKRLEALRGFGCSSAVVLAWDSGDKESSMGVLEAAGFQRLAELKEYWREPEGSETFDCVKCGRPCLCSALVMRRPLYDLRH